MTILLFLLSYGEISDPKKLFLIYIYQTGLDSFIKRPPTTTTPTPGSLNVTWIIKKLLRQLRFHHIFCLILIWPTSLFNSVSHAASEPMWSCQTSLVWFSLMNIPARVPSRVHKISGLQFFLRAKRFCGGVLSESSCCWGPYPQSVWPTGCPSCPSSPGRYRWNHRVLQNHKPPTVSLTVPRAKWQICSGNKSFCVRYKTSKMFLLVIGSISKLSLKRRELINSCEKVITDLKSLLRLNSVLIAVDMKINYSVLSCFQLQWW